MFGSIGVWGGQGWDVTGAVVLDHTSRWNALAQGGVTVGVEPLCEAGGPREQVEPVYSARVHAQLGRHARLDEALGVASVPTASPT